MQMVATTIFFVVFLQLFIALSLWLWKTIYDLIKVYQKPKLPTILLVVEKKEEEK